MKEEPIKPEQIPHNPKTDIEEVFYIANSAIFKDFKLWYENRFKPAESYSSEVLSDLIKEVKPESVSLEEAALKEYPIVMTEYRTMNDVQSFDSNEGERMAFIKGAKHSSVVKLYLESLK